MLKETSARKVANHVGGAVAGGFTTLPVLCAAYELSRWRSASTSSANAGEKHWHGATATTAMSHIAIQEKLDGKVVDWMEKVSDEQYRRSDQKP